jgi:hypothetical protein
MCNSGSFAGQVWEYHDFREFLRHHIQLGRLPLGTLRIPYSTLGSSRKKKFRTGAFPLDFRG